MNAGAAAVAITAALAAGWYFRAWRIAAGDRVAAKGRLAGAGKALWRARWPAGIMVIVVWALANMWVNGGGR